MRHLVFFATMVLASLDVRADTCVLKAPLKAIRSQGARWESLKAGTELSILQRKPDWTRVQHQSTTHLVGTKQLEATCTATTTAPATTATTTAPATTTTAPATTTAATATAATTAATTTAATTNAPATTTTAPAAEPTTTVAAAEKTDTVDKPERLSLSTAPSGSFSQILVLVLLAIGAGAAILFRRRGVQEQPLLDVVATRVLGRGKQLVVVNTGDSRLLLAVTEQGINVLSSTPAPGPGHLELPEMRETNDRSGAGGLLKSMGNKVTGLWGRAPSGPPTEWDHFDRILASTVPPGSDVAPVDPDVPSSKFRRAPERPSSPASPTSADLAELTRELHRHNPRRSA